jgi:hypothetical protein
VPTDADIYQSKSYANNALVQPEPRAVSAHSRSGMGRAVRAMHPDAPMYIWIQAETVGNAISASTICC